MERIRPGKRAHARRESSTITMEDSVYIFACMRKGALGEERPLDDQFCFLFPFGPQRGVVTLCSSIERYPGVPGVEQKALFGTRVTVPQEGRHESAVMGLNGQIPLVRENKT